MKEVQEVRTIKNMILEIRMELLEIQNWGCIQYLRLEESGTHFWRPPLFPGDRVVRNLLGFAKDLRKRAVSDPLWAVSEKPTRESIADPIWAGSVRPT